MSLVETYEHYPASACINEQLIKKSMTEARLFDDSKHLDLIYKLFGFDRIIHDKELLLVFEEVSLFFSFLTIVFLGFWPKI